VGGGKLVGGGGGGGGGGVLSLTLLPLKDDPGCVYA